MFVGTGCAQPELVRALVARAAELADTEIVHLLTLGDAPYARSELAGYFRVNTFFIAENVRDIIQEGLGDYTPIFLSDIPRLFSSGQLPLDVALIQVTPPDERGMCSLGISVDIVKSAAENAGAGHRPGQPADAAHAGRQLHPRVRPRRPGAGGRAAPRDDAPGEPDRDAAARSASTSPRWSRTARPSSWASARIPHAVLEFLKDKKDLGIHTEMFTDAIIDLIESGAITGAQKTLDRGKIVASFCMGTQRLYDYIDNNPLFAFHPTEYVNDPFVIGQQHKMVAINVALEVDLTGQVCADSLGTQFYSGIGGQVDFNRGAARSAGGKAIIALPSTAQNGTISRIVATLEPRRRRGHHPRRRALRRHRVRRRLPARQERPGAGPGAHQHRPSRLPRAASARGHRVQVPAPGDGATSRARFFVGPQELRTTHAARRRHADQLPPHPPHRRAADAATCFYALSQETIYYRFMSQHEAHPAASRSQNFVYIDHRNEVAIVGTLPEAHGEDIIAVGRYYLDPKTNRAEVAFVVRDAWQNRGIGTFLLKHLANIAKRKASAASRPRSCGTTRPCRPCSTTATTASPAGWTVTCIASGLILLVLCVTSAMPASASSSHV